MIYWSRLLAIAHAVSCSTELYLPLFLWKDRDLDPFLIGMLTAVVLIFRLMASSVCIWWIDRSDPTTHIQLLMGLSVIGSLALVGVYMSPNNLTLLILLMVANGLFYQPLTSLVDSAIIKSLGDYKSWLYENERQWANAFLGLTLLLIGCISDLWSNNKYLDYILTGIILIGCISLLCITLTLIYRHNGVMLLDYMMITDEYDDGINGNDGYYEETMTAAPRFLKNALLFQPPQHYYNDSLIHAYKPYSLFGEPLSHISEEDASMLRRMTSSNSNQLMRRSSNQSVSSTTTTASIAALAASGSVPIAVYGSTNTATTTQHPLDFFSSAWRRYNSITQQQHSHTQQASNLPPNVNVNGAITATLSHHSQQQQQNYYQQQQQQQQQQTQQQIQLASSVELSLLPLPPSNTPMSVLLSLHVDGGGTMVDQLIQWQIQSMSLTTLMLGVIYGMMNTLLFIYLYQVLDLSMWMIGLAAMAPVFTEIFVHITAQWWIPQFTITVTTTIVHAALIICSFVYSWLRPDWPMLWLQILVLQVVQGMSFPLIWLVMTQRICALLWTDEEQRIAQVGKLSALFSIIGPAVGALLAGFLLSGDDSAVGSSSVTNTNTEAMDAFLMAGYTLVFRCNIALTAASFVVSWGWSSTD